MQGTFLIRRGLAASWAVVNPVLMSGQIGYETDTRKMKVGDSATNWNSLEYSNIFEAEDIPYDPTTSDLVMLNPLWVDDGSQTDPDTAGQPRYIPVGTVQEAIDAAVLRMTKLEEQAVESDDDSIVVEITSTGINITTEAAIIPTEKNEWMTGDTVQEQLDELAGFTGDPADLAVGMTTTLVDALNEHQDRLEDYLVSDDESVEITPEVDASSNPTGRFDLSVDITKTDASQVVKNPGTQGTLPTNLNDLLSWMNANLIVQTYNDGTKVVVRHQDSVMVNTDDGAGNKVGVDALFNVTTETAQGGTAMGDGSTSKTDIDGSWAMFGTYYANEAPSVLTNKDGSTTNLFVRAQVTHRDSSNNGVRLLVLSNDKIYYKVGTDNNVTFNQEIGMGSGGSASLYTFAGIPSTDTTITLTGVQTGMQYTVSQTDGTPTLLDITEPQVGSIINFMTTREDTVNSLYSGIIMATGIVTAINFGTTPSTITVDVTISAPGAYNRTDGTDTYQTNVKVTGNGYEITETNDATGAASSMLVDQVDEKIGFNQDDGQGDETFIGIEEGKAIYNKTADGTNNQEVMNLVAFLNRAGMLTNLTTLAQNNLVAAINEVNAKATSSMSLVGWASFLAATTADMNAIVTAQDLAFCFNFQTSTWYYWSNTTTNWITLPIGWAKGVDDVVRLTGELPAVGQWDGFIMGVLGDGTIHQWDQATTTWNDITTTWTPPVDNEGDQYLIRSYWGVWQGTTFTGAPNAVLTKTGVGWTYIVNIQTDFDDLKDTDWS